MRIVQINSVPNLSTGTVMLENHKRYEAEGNESWRMWGRGRAAENEYEFNFGNKLGTYIDAAQTRIDGKASFHSRAATKRLLAKLNEIQPDLVHLHNLHGYYVNIEMLFNWLATHDCKVEWTLHDCWAFTGHCAYFTYAKCAQWRSHCACSEKCPQLHTYPSTFSSSSSCRWSFEQKRHLFNLLPSERMTLITPSQWLADLVKQSFLSKYPVEVRYNTVDETIFKPTPSDFRERHGVGDRFMILGVASSWTERKGLNDFLRLQKKLDPTKYAIVLVGLNDEQLMCFPEGIIGIKRTDSREELAGIYSTADVFFNPTVEDNYPTVNLEAEACGTAVVTYNTGGCAETVHRHDSLIVEGFDAAVRTINASSSDSSDNREIFA